LRVNFDTLGERTKIIAAIAAAQDLERDIGR
jgi:hypothetical protein